MNKPQRWQIPTDCMSLAINNFIDGDLEEKVFLIVNRSFLIKKLIQI